MFVSRPTPPTTCLGHRLMPIPQPADHLRQNLEADDTASFHFVDGLYDVDSLPDDEYQCPPPNFLYFDYTVVSVDQGFRSIAAKLTFDDLSKPEDKMRRTWMVYRPLKGNLNAAAVTLDYVRNIIEEEGPFHGVIGGSEGGCAAATVLLDQLDLARTAGVPATMKCGIFFVSPPALRADGKGWYLNDEESDGRRITVPTCHVYSDEDPLAWMSHCLSNTCQEEGKTHILHDQGHVIPHTKELMVEVAKFVRRVKRAAGVQA